MLHYPTLFYTCKTNFIEPEDFYFIRVNQFNQCHQCAKIVDNRTRMFIDLTRFLWI